MLSAAELQLFLYLEILDVLDRGELWQACSEHQCKEGDEEVAVLAQDQVGFLTVLPEPVPCKGPNRDSYTPGNVCSHCQPLSPALTNTGCRNTVQSGQRWLQNPQCTSQTHPMPPQQAPGTKPHQLPFRKDKSARGQGSVPSP